MALRATMVRMPSEPRPHPVESAIRRRIDGKSQTHGIDVALAALAGRQHGVVSRRQMRDLGFGDDAVDLRISRGQLHRMHAGVFAVGHERTSRHGHWMAAVLTGVGDAVLSHRSAAALWGLRGGGTERIDVTCGHKSRSTARLRRHLSVLPPDEVAVHEGIPVTSVPRTVFDLAAGGDVDLVENLIRQSERRPELFDRLSLPTLVARCPRRRGRRTVQLALARIEESPGGTTESPLEEVFLPFLRAHGLPIPRLNEWIDLGEARYRVDCRWPGTREIVELDGWETHGTKTAFRDDRQRDRRLRVAGYGLTRLTWNQIRDEPGAIADDLRELLGIHPSVITYAAR
jgi:very-short-patch-repair endonuclease